MSGLIRELYAEWITQWYEHWAFPYIEEIGYVPSDADNFVAFLSWASVIYGADISYDELDAALF